MRNATTFAAAMLAAANFLCVIHAAERPPVVPVVPVVPVGPEVIVTTTRFPAVDPPLSPGVTVITAEAIRASAAQTVPDLLAREAGIGVRDLFGNNASGVTVDMRGFGSTGAQNTLILVDGRRVNDIDLAGVQWSALPLAAIERIEIVRGSGAVLYGDGASAGVINIITRSPLAQPSSVSVAARYGAYDTRELQLRANYAGKSAGFSVQAGDLHAGGYRDNNRNRQHHALADVYWLTDVGEFVLKLAADRQGLRLPGARRVQPSAGVNEFATNPRGAQTPLDYAQLDGDRAVLDWRFGTGPVEVNLSGGWRSKAQTSYFDFGGFPDYRVSDLNVWSLTPRVKITTPIAGHANTLVAGVDWYHWDYQRLLSNSPVNISRPINTVQATQKNAAIYARNTLQLYPRVALDAGYRHETFRINGNDRIDPAAPGGGFGLGAPPATGSQRETGRAYEVGLRYQPAAQTVLSARTGTSFRFANVDEVYETNAAFINQFQFLRPQRTRTHELGYETRGTAGRVRASLFTMDVRDEIHLDPFTTGIGNTNLPPSRRRGLELDGQWRASATVTLGMAYSLIDAKFREGTFPGSAFTQTNIAIAGKTVPLVPRHKLHAHAAWAMHPHMRLNLSASYVGAQFVDNDEANSLGTKIPAYTLVDLSVMYRHGSWRVGAAINNLLDREYYNYAVRSQFVPDRYNVYPLPRRHAWLSAAYEFR